VNPRNFYAELTRRNVLRSVRDAGIEPATLACETLTATSRLLVNVRYRAGIIRVARIAIRRGRESNPRPES
jgi:hypothetical protein